MNSKFRLLVALLSLIAPSLSIYTPYYSGENSCPFGQFPVCLAQWNNGAPTTSSSLISTQCTKCPVGTATFGSSDNSGTAAGGSSYKNYGCQQCQGGYYANETGTVSCQACPEGSDCMDPSATPRLCPKGTAYSLVWTEGTFYGYNAICKTCPDNTYASKVGSIQCTPCPSGYYCPDPRLDPIVCPKGTSTDMPSNGYWPGSYPYYYSGQNRCQQCPTGYYTPSTGSSVCTLCPDGSYCPDPTRAIKCPVGTYRKNYPYQIKFPRQKFMIPMDSTFCVRCPQGYYANVEGSTTCIKCPKGSYCADPTILPKTTPVGTFSNSEYGQQQPFPCPDGFYSTAQGNKNCTRCPDGSYCPDVSAAPKKCPIGTYSNSTMPKMACARCPPGTYATTTGMTACNQCPIGKCCLDPTQNPTPCPIIPTSTPSWISDSSPSSDFTDFTTTASV